MNSSDVLKWLVLQWFLLKRCSKTSIFLRCSSKSPSSDDHLLKKCSKPSSGDFFQKHYVSQMSSSEEMFRSVWFL